MYDRNRFIVVTCKKLVVYAQMVRILYETLGVKQIKTVNEKNDCLHTNDGQTCAVKRRSKECKGFDEMFEKISFLKARKQCEIYRFACT